MSRVPLSVTWSEMDASRLPDWASPTCALVASLRRRDMFDVLGERLRIVRQGGYAGIDIFLMLLYFFGSGQSGIRSFWMRALPHALQLGALAGRRGLPSPASVSRALDRVDLELLRPLTTWLLAEVTGADDVLRHPTVLTRDACGQGWHIFHFDPTVTTLRQRSLPVDDDLPPARRRAEGMAVPGHQGRKRGEISFRRAALQHAGSSLWIHATLTPGNGNRRSDVATAADAVVATCARIGHPLGLALFVCDGEFANVPAYTTFREKKLPFITRFVRYDLLDQPDIRHQLASSVWLEVADDRSGPRRSAIDLGMVTVHAGERTVREDGSPYAPLSLRVVATRYARSGEPEHGRVIDDWQYELFAVDADTEAWPAPDAVRVFFGRSGQENRFAQEDRELGLDRVFSYHLPGQELASLVGLMLWNLQVVQGFKLDKPPTELEPQPPRNAKVDPRASEPLSPEPEPEPDEPMPAEPSALEEKRTEWMARIDWTPWEAKNPGWRWSRATGHLECPNQQALRLIGVSIPNQKPNVRPQLFFAGREGACAGCPFRAECTRVQVEPFFKKMGVSVDLLHAKKLKRTFGVKGAKRSPFTGPRRRKSAMRTNLAPLEPVAGPHAVADSCFLPAEARQIFRAAVHDLTVRVTVRLPPPAPKRPTLVSLSSAHRQHRRKTWTEHLARYALPEASEVQVEYSGSGAARRLLNAAVARPAA